MQEIRPLKNFFNKKLPQKQHLTRITAAVAAVIAVPAILLGMALADFGMARLLLTILVALGQVSLVALLGRKIAEFEGLGREAPSISWSEFFARGGRL